MKYQFERTRSDFWITVYENDDAYRKKQEELLEQSQKAQEKYKKALEEYEKIDIEAQVAREKYV